MAQLAATPAARSASARRRRPGPTLSRWWMIRYASVAASSLAYSSLFVSPVAVEHRLAGVEQDVADEVGLLLVLLDRVAFGAAVALPVDVADVVAGDVLAVLDELDREAAERALVVADAQALDDRRGP